jgi:hypothetical protein
VRIFFWFALGRELFEYGCVGYFLDEDGEFSEFAGWFELGIVVIKFEKTLTLREMVYLDGNLASGGARHTAW